MEGWMDGWTDGWEEREGAIGGEERSREGTDRSRPVDAELRYTINGAAGAGVGDAASRCCGPASTGPRHIHTGPFARGRCMSILRSKKSRSWWSDAWEPPLNLAEKCFLFFPLHLGGFWDVGRQRTRRHAAHLASWEARATGGAGGPGHATEAMAAQATAMLREGGERGGAAASGGGVTLQGRANQPKKQTICSQPIKEKA